MFLVTLSHSSPPQCHNFCHVLHFYNIGPCSHSLRRDGCCKMLLFYFLGSQFTAPCLYCLNCFNTDEESPTMCLATGLWLAKRLLRSFSLVTDTIQAAKWLTSAPYLVSTPPRERKLAPRWCWSMCLLCVTWPHAPHGHRVHHPLWRRVTQYPGLCTLKYAGGRESNIVRTQIAGHLPSPSFWHCTLGIVWGVWVQLRAGMDHVPGKWEHYRPELQSQIGLWRGDHFIKVHMTFIASIKLNQDKSVHSRHINHSNLTLIKTTIWFQPSSLGFSRLDKIYIWTSHTALCNCCVVFSHLELAVINAFVMTMDLDTHKPVTTCTPLMGVSTLTSLMATGHLKRSSVIV